jgi:hypothetical protein
MASLIYGVSRNDRKGLGCIESIKPDKSQKVKPKPLYVHFVLAGTELDTSAQTQKHTKDKNYVLKPKYHAQISHDYPSAKRPKVVRNSRKANKRGPKKWVPKDKIIYGADILNNSAETPVMVPG